MALKAGLCDNHQLDYPVTCVLHLVTVTVTAGHDSLKQVTGHGGIPLQGTAPNLLCTGTCTPAIIQVPSMILDLSQSTVHLQGTCCPEHQLRTCLRTSHGILCTTLDHGTCQCTLCIAHQSDELQSKAHAACGMHIHMNDCCHICIVSVQLLAMTQLDLLPKCMD